MGVQKITEQENIEKIWCNCFEIFEEVIDRVTYEMVVKNAKPVVRNPDTVELLLPWVWQRDKLEKYTDLIADIYSERIGRKINFVLLVGKNGNPINHVITQPSGKKLKSKDRPVFEKKMENKKSINLDTRYTFDTFIIGNNNRIAAAAAEAVADGPARTYNPLFIYGGVGLGKTHLLNAIGNHVLKRKINANVVYVSAEKFMNDFVESIQEKKMQHFRRKYRFTDLFLIDDIQFIKNKELMQEEFFHTFNELHRAKSQIVITSDRPPKEIATLEDRLRSRFEWGLIADIQPPELETRMAILKKKAELENIQVPNEVIAYIAERIISNIRELEGALNKIILLSSLINSPIDMELCTQALKEILPDVRQKHITIKLIQEKVCEYYNLNMNELLGSCRESRFVVPRHMAMYLSREIVAASFPTIGKAFGGRDHTTIQHACKKLRKKKRDSSTKNDLVNIKNMLKNPGG